MLLQPSGPILTEKEIEKMLDQDDFEAKAVLLEVNARKPIHTMYNPKQNFTNEIHHGLNANIQRGYLDLTMA